MKTLKITASELNNVHPENLIYSCWVGSDDILVVDGHEVIEMAKDIEDKSAEKLTLAKAMEYVIQDSSGNSFEFVLVVCNMPYTLDIDWDK